MAKRIFGVFLERSTIDEIRNRSFIEKKSMSEFARNILIETLKPKPIQGIEKTREYQKLTGKIKSF